MSPSRSSAFRIPLVLALALACLVGLAAGCSSDDVADTIAEKATESAGGEDVDVDIDSESGEYSVKTEDGETKLSYGSNDLPDSWPDEVPLPADYTLTSAVESNTDGSPVYNVTGTVDADATDTFDDITGRFSDEGWTEEQKATGSFGDDVNAGATFSNDSWQVTVGVNGSNGGETTFSYTVLPASQ